MIHDLFSSLPSASIRNTRLLYVPAWFYTHLHLFIIVLLMKLRTGVDVLRAGGLGSYDSRGWNPGQGVFHGHYCHIWRVRCRDCSEVPLWTHSGDSAVFSLEEVLSDKQETGGAFWQSCCPKQNKKHGWFVVVDQQLLIYALENLQRTQCFWKGF